MSDLVTNSPLSYRMPDLVPHSHFIHNNTPIQYSPFSHRIQVLFVSAEESKISSALTFSDVAVMVTVSQTVCSGLSRNKKSDKLIGVE